MEVEEVRCGNCRKLLAKASYNRLQIKCPRCGTLNDMRAIEPQTRTPRASTKEDDTRGVSTSENQAGQK